MTTIELATSRGIGKLPPGWRRARLGEVCQRVTSADPRRFPDAPFVYVDISSVDNEAKTIVEPKGLLGKDAPSRARQVIREGDVLVATTRPNLNAVALVPQELDGQVCSTGFCVLRPGPELSSQFLTAYVRSEEFVQSLSALVVGALYPAVTDTLVRDQYIPLPPLPDQRRIAAILTEQLAAVDGARTAAGEQLAAAKALPAGYLRAAFERDDAWTWPERRLGQLLKLRKEVVHPYDHPKGRATFVGLEHLESQTGLRTGALEVEMSSLTGRKPRFYRGDLVYGYLRPYLNKVWIAEFDGLCSVDQYVYSVVSEVDTRFIAWFMRSPVYLNRAPIGTTPGQLPRIRTDEVASVELNLPPLSVQQQIADQLDEHMAGANRMQMALDAQLDAINRLPAALLRRAFSGALASAAPSAGIQGRASDEYPELGAVAAYVIASLWREKRFGRIKLEKLLYLAEVHAGVNLDGDYERAAAGPLDRRIYQAESTATRKRWFTIDGRPGEAVKYQPGAHLKSALELALRVLAAQRTEVDRIVTLLRQRRTRWVEGVATLYAAWNDRLLDGRSVRDDDIIMEVRHNWHPDKQKFQPIVLRSMLAWMRQNALVPTGNGAHTRVRQPG